MAHAADKKAAARQAYVFDRLPQTGAAQAAGVPLATLRNWMRAAKRAGDDWEAARAASAMSARGSESIVQAVMNEYLLQHQATTAALQADPAIPPLEKAEVLSRLADSFIKHVNAAGRISPKLNKKAVALDVIEGLLEFTKNHHPQHAAALIEVLLPFGAYIEGVL